MLGSTVRALLTALVASLLLLPSAGLAQAPPGPAKGKGKPPAKGVKPEESEDVRLRCEKQELVAKGHFRATGFVDLKIGETRVQADALDLYESERPDGSTGRRIVATGNVVFLRGEERIAGERLDMDLETGIGTFTQALGYVQPGVFVEAKTIERIDATTYRVTGAKFTSCSQPNPRWGFTASSAKIHVDDKIVGSNVFFKVKSVPAFYLPYFVYPIRDDQRSTGFLFPHFGYSSLRGFNVGSGFFWAMGRSFDQTLYADHYSRFGYGLGHEFRYSLDAPSRGTFRTYFLRPQGGGAWDYDLDYNAIQTLPAKFRGTVQVRRFSNLQFQQRIQDGLNQASVRNRRSTATLRRSFGATSFEALADSNETFFESDAGETLRVNRRLPSLRLSRFAQRHGRSPLVFGFEARGEELGLGEKFEDEGTIFKYSRVDVAPDLSFSGGTSFLQLTPRAQLRYTRYGKTIDLESQDASITGSPIDRRYFEGSLEMTGPTFSRIFNNPGKWYTDKFKHTIGPVATYRYRTKVEDFERFPKFDGNDQIFGTNEIQYGIEQHFFARRPAAGKAGKPNPYEFLTWRIVQTYYVDIKNGQNDFDPNYSSAVFGVEGVPDHNSPIRSDMRFRPTPRFNSNFVLEYDVNFKQLRRLSLSSRLDTSRFDFQGGWSRAFRPDSQKQRLQVSSDTVQGSAKLDLSSSLHLEGSGYYDIIKKKLLNSRVRLRYDVQCCGFVTEMIQFNFASRVERQFRFSIELANIGSMGNFNGDDTRGSSPGGGFAGGLR